MHSQHDMIAHFLAYKIKNSEMALLFSVPQMQILMPQAVTLMETLTF